MMDPNDKSRIEELKKSLYSRATADVRTRRKLRFSDVSSDLKTTFGGLDEEKVATTLNKEYEDHSMSFFTKILIASTLFCIVAVGAGAYLFFNGANLISGNNIDIQINGPVSIAGGDPVSFDVTATNNNNVDLQLVDMSVDFPDGTTDPLNPTQTLKNYQHVIGDMSAGASAHQTVKAIIFGEENMQKEITVTLTYQIKGSSSVFTKQKTYDVLINSSPITVSVSSFSQITSGQEFDLKVDVKSNSAQTLKNLVLKGVYPFGYTFISSTVKPLSDGATWTIGDLPPGGDKVITVHGKLQGSDNDTRIFHFAVGAQSSSDPKLIGTQYMTAEQDMTIQKPFVSLAVSVDGDSSTNDHVGQFNQPEHVEISWTNNLPVSISNLQITAKLSGTAYDKTAVQPDIGYFRSLTNDMVWNQQTNPELATVNAGDSGTVSFTIVPKDLGTASHPLVNPIVSFDVSVAADRVQEANAPGTLASVVTRNVRVSSSVSLTGRVVRTNGPFTNTGPIPPKAEQPTTYTIVWTINNSANPVSNAQVTATLPPYVKWLGVSSPSTEALTYDQNSGLVTWNAGNVPAYTDASHRKEVAFQISFIPSITQVQQTPTLVNQASLTGVDSFTTAQLQAQQDYLTTRFSTDPSYKTGQETVVQ